MNWDLIYLSDQFFELMGLGGYVMPPLFFITIILWYTLTYRLFVVQTNKNNPRRKIEKRLEDPDKTVKTIMDDAVLRGLMTANQFPQDVRSNLNVTFWEYRTTMRKYKGVITVLLVIAPLLGLLGTVSGMIETFDSLQDMTFMSQDGGIAAGISQALVTTQFGLSISIPGLLLHSYINRRQTLIEQELEQLIDILSSNPGIAANFKSTLL